jgi:hypothetical protein
MIPLEEFLRSFGRMPVYEPSQRAGRPIARSDVEYERDHRVELVLCNGHVYCTDDFQRCPMRIV